MSKQTRTRIMSEIKDMQKNPPDGIIAAPLESNLFEWHFTIKGADDTEFEGGRYHGKFVLPSNYPFKAPDVLMYTKSGRFEVGKKICLNFTGYHHELWQPAWTIRTMLTALRAFMETPAQGVGAITVDKKQRKIYAKQSLNYKCPKCGIKMNDVVFAEINRTKKNKDKKNDNNNNEMEITDVDNTNDEVLDDLDPPQEAVEIDATQINESEPLMDEKNENDESDEKLIDDESIDNNESSVTVQVQQPAANRKDRMLDHFTVILVVIIIGILFKKFALRFMEQL